MDEQNTIPSLEDLKNQAKRLRASLAESGHAVSHSQSLEQIAHQYGAKDWNTLHASAGNGSPDFPPKMGDRVSGLYLGHAFNAEVLGVQAHHPGNRYRITLKFDEAVDVVAFEGMSSWRKRVTTTVGPDGRTVEKTSNGQPQLVLNG